MAHAPASRIGRIRIDALIGTGGMGEVYRGWDEKLERAVALKVVHADKRMSASVRNRFLREARVLSKLDHPNICRLYDVLEREDGDYLVLELVEGATLRERMHTPLPRRDALEVALHVARVLATTHARGIVHRDLKPDNIMLTPEGVVKVLDFGLARAVVEGEQQPIEEEELFAADDIEKTAVLRRATDPSTTEDETHTSAGSLVGTLHYMSPEQARGLPLTESTDIYSLGIVMLEMLTGARAYGDTASMNDLLVRVRGAAVERVDLRDRALRALLRRMLALYPADRPRADEVVRALEDLLARPSRIRRRVIASLAAGVIVLLIAGAFLVSRSLASTQRSLFGENKRGRVAILPFRNATNDKSLQWIEGGLADLVTEGVRRARGADVVSSDEVARAWKNLKLSATRDLSESQRRALLTALGADVAILPIVVADEGKYTIRYAALRPDGEEQPRESTSTVLVDAAREMSVQLAQRIDPSSSAAQLRARYSLDATANTLLAMGVQELRERGPKIAAHYFQVCLDRDPEFVVAQMYLADAHKQLAENARAEELLADALARAQRKNDRALLARGLITRASWLIDGGDLVGAERAAAQGLAHARAIGDDDLAASALNNLGHAAWRRGQLDRAGSVFTEALGIATRLRDPRLQSLILNDLGVVADSAQRREEAHADFTKALALADRANDRLTIATVIGNLALSWGARGDFARAEALTRRQVALCREIGDTGSEIIAAVNLGLWLWAQGKEREAVETTEQAIGLVQRVGNPRIETALHANLSWAYAKLGDLAASARHAEIARKASAGLNDPEVDRDAQLGLAYGQTRAGRLNDAERTLDRAERWQKNERTLLMRARLAYARREYARALELIEQARAAGGPWLIQNEQMHRAFAESAKTGRPSSIEFESALR